MGKTMKPHRCGLKHLLAGVIAGALFMLAACAPAQSVALAATPEPTPSATAAPTPTPSPTPEPTPSPTPTPEPTPVLSREEEIAFLGIDYYDESQFLPAGCYTFIYCALQNGEKIVIPTFFTTHMGEYTDFRYMFNYESIITFSPDICANQIPLEFMLEETSHTYLIANLDGAVIEGITGLFNFQRYCKKYGIEILESEEYIEMMDFIKEGGAESFSNKEVKLGDFANFYISCLKKENRINAAFVNATVRTRGILAPGQTPYTTPAPTPTPTIAGSF